MLELGSYSLRDSTLYNYTNHLYSYVFLHDNHGITLTPSEIYYASGGIIRCWYNRDENQYWDNDKKLWSKIPPSCNDDFNVDTINDVGAIGMFAYIGDIDSPIQYGTLVDSTSLKPISINFPSSGQLNYTKVSVDTITGTLKLLSPVQRSSSTDPSVVMALKVSDDQLIPSDILNTNKSHKPLTVAVTEYIIYDL